MFTCDSCNKEYLKEGCLIKHRLVCNKTFTCDDCGSNFKYKTALTRHKKTCKSIEKKDTENNNLSVIIEALKKENRSILKEKNATKES